MKKLKGIGVSPGVAIGRVLIKIPALAVPQKKAGAGLQAEADRFDKACTAVAGELLAIAEQMKKQTGEKEAEIFAAHSRIAQDRVLRRETLKLIDTENAAAEWALYSAAQKLTARLSAANDPLISARADDIRDVSGRMVRRLMGATQSDTEIPPGSIIVADELLPSDTATLPRDRVAGFLTEKGGFTSHVAIMARALEIPAVVGVADIRKLVANGEKLALDGETGEVALSPDSAANAEFTERLKVYARQKEIVAVYKSRPTQTLDGRSLHVEGNIGNLADLDAALANGCEGVGLFRTEFLFMENNTLPTEEEQYKVYHQAAKKLGERPLIIRTLDIGGDKPVSYLNIEKEENPFLGLRAIRHSLANKPIFMPQIRAILRAGEGGNVRMMLPMIATLAELLQAKQLVEEAMRQLAAEGIAHGAVPVGIMIEIPAAAVMADVLARHCDFFSIGTNDLIQYTVAVDRGNSEVAYLYNMYEPAVLRLIRHTIESAHAQGIPVGMCGEAAGFLPLVPVLVAMGLDAFSVNPPLVPSVRAAIHKVDTGKSKDILAQAEQFSSAEDAQKTLNNSIF